MPWLIIMAATFGPQFTPADCERVSAIVQRVIQAEAGPANIRLKCQPYPALMPTIPIPQSVLPPPPAPLPGVPQ